MAVPDASHPGRFEKPVGERARRRGHRESVAMASILKDLILHREALAAALTTIDSTISALAIVQAETKKKLRLARTPTRMTITGAARYLRVSRTTVYKLIDSGELRTFHLLDDSSAVSLEKADLDAYLANRPNAGRRRGGEP
jgi:excisionase family DNA binding protein